MSDMRLLLGEFSSTAQAYLSIYEGIESATKCFYSEVNTMVLSTEPALKGQTAENLLKFSTSVTKALKSELGDIMKQAGDAISSDNGFVNCIENTDKLTVIFNEIF